MPESEDDLPWYGKVISVVVGVPLLIGMIAFLIWFVGAVTLLLAWAGNELLIPLGMQDYRLQYADEYVAPFVAGAVTTAVAALGWFLIATRSKAHETFEVESAPRQASPVAAPVPARQNVDVASQASDKQLFQAVYDLDSARVRQLLAAGANPNATNALGQNPMHFCLKNSRENVDSQKHEILTILLAAGSDCTARDDQGRLPIDYAEIMEESRCIALLSSGDVSRGAASTDRRMCWQCPSCGGILHKQRGTLEVAGAAQLVGAATCSFCDTAHDAAAVYGGAYDFVASDETIEAAAMDSPNMVFDEEAQLWLYKGQPLELVNRPRITASSE